MDRDEGKGAFGGDALGHLDALHRVALRMTHRASEAEDLVQETYLRAFRGADRFAPGTNLRAWLFRVMRNIFLDGRRREGRNPMEPVADLDALPGSEADGSDFLRGDVELERLRRVVARELEDALEGLPEDARTVVLLDLEGLSEAEIATVMGCAAGTVKSRLHRARLALRRQLADYRR